MVGIGRYLAVDHVPRLISGLIQLRTNCHWPAKIWVTLTLIDCIRLHHYQIFKFSVEERALFSSPRHFYCFTIPICSIPTSAAIRPLHYSKICLLQIVLSPLENGSATISFSPKFSKQITEHHVWSSRCRILSWGYFTWKAEEINSGCSRPGLSFGLVWWR